VCESVWAYVSWRGVVGVSYSHARSISEKCVCAFEGGWYFGVV